jgi:hypothetical protein
MPAWGRTLGSGSKATNGAVGQQTVVAGLQGKAHQPSKPYRSGVGQMGYPGDVPVDPPSLPVFVPLLVALKR